MTLRCSFRFFHSLTSSLWFFFIQPTMPIVRLFQLQWRLSTWSAESLLRLAQIFGFWHMRLHRLGNDLNSAHFYSICTELMYGVTPYIFKFDSLDFFTAMGKSPSTGSNTAFYIFSISLSGEINYLLFIFSRVYGR